MSGRVASLMPRWARGRTLSRTHRQVILTFLAAVLLFLLGGVIQSSFLRFSNVSTTLVIASFIAIAAAGQTFVILIAGIDLSVPWVLNSAAIMMTVLAAGSNHRLVFALPVVLGLAALVGAINGMGIAYLGVPAIVMTLGMNGIMQGAILQYTGSLTCPHCADYAPSILTKIMNDSYHGIPYALVVLVIITIILSLVLARTKFGRYIYSVGNNADASYLAGINVKRVTVTAYSLGGLFSALAGVALMGYSGIPDLGMGDPYLFLTIAAVVIGGASILGGRGNYLGTVAGAIILVVLVDLMNILKISEAGRNVLYGAVIIVALLLYGRETREV